jgi:hypothetical protein
METVNTKEAGMFITYDESGMKKLYLKKGADLIILDEAEIQELLLMLR